MRERIKENDRDTRFARTQTSAVSEHANETGHIPIWSKVNFIDRDPHWCTRKVKEDINIRFHPKNINKDSGIEIPEAWICGPMREHHLTTRMIMRIEMYQHCGSQPTCYK